MTTTEGNVQAWWDRNPMTYGPVHGQTGGPPIGSPAFFDRADARFLEQARFASRGGVLLGQLIDYAALAGHDVLEVGSGLGAIAQRLAQTGARVTALDLTPRATAAVAARRRIHDLSALQPIQASALALPFPAARFDRVISWGVLHHTPDPAQAVREIHRVLRPGGRAQVMLYHRHSLRYWLDKRLREGLLLIESDFLDDDALMARYSDGWENEGNPITRVYTRRAAAALFAPFARVRVSVCGNLQVSYRHYLPVVWRWVPEWLEDYWSRRVGWFLWIDAEV